ncbi:hypothetical protein D5086_023746 [Populus alba]|uniref:Uncharacterized protein n=2 Tax=Populus alba TaxID=43335 RepID=A0A4U5Q3M9_POPAL|nr:uncharacterized protein LOC118060625 isoform X1 [Populus alba]TKS04583.1 hypothetical protein D5086_0000143080 [Populus alba]
MIRWIKKKLRNIKVAEREQRRISSVSLEEHCQVLEERNSLEDQLSQAKMKIAGLENSRAFEVQETMKFLNYLVSDGKKEEDDARDKEIQRLNLELCKKELEINEKLNLRDAEIHRLKMIIKFMCSDLEKAFATAKSALPDPHVLPQILEEPRKKPQEEDIIGAVITPVISRDGSHS